MGDHPGQVLMPIQESSMGPIRPNRCGLAYSKPAYWTHWFPILHKREKRAVFS